MFERRAATLKVSNGPNSASASIAARQYSSGSRFVWNASEQRATPGTWAMSGMARSASPLVEKVTRIWPEMRVTHETEKAAKAAFNESMRTRSNRVRFLPLSPIS